MHLTFLKLTGAPAGKREQISENNWAVISPTKNPETLKNSTNEKLITYAYDNQMPKMFIYLSAEIYC